MPDHTLAACRCLNATLAAVACRSSCFSGCPPTVKCIRFYPPTFEWSSLNFFIARNLSDSHQTKHVLICFKSSGTYFKFISSHENTYAWFELGKFADANAYFSFDKLTSVCSGLFLGEAMLKGFTASSQLWTYKNRIESKTRVNIYWQ